MARYSLLGRGNKFCSVECSFEYKYKMVKLYVYTCSTFDGALSSPRSMKSFLIKDRGRCCEICKGSEWMGKPIPLVLDHINGDYTDNRLQNLRLFCGNCNMQLPTYKSKNRNSKRVYRKKYREKYLNTEAQVGG